MSDQSKKIALVTGANSGIGFETAAQFAKAGYRKVHVGARSEKKAKAAVAALKERIGREVFAPVAMDLSELDSIQAAVDSLKTQEGVIDSLVMGAGVMFPRLTRNSAGMDLTYGVNLVGHHALVMRLLAAGKLGRNARLIFMGSEASRGDLRGIKLMDFGALSEGSLENTFESVVRGDQPPEYKMMTRYATNKLFAVWWAAALSRRLPLGMTINVGSGQSPRSATTRSSRTPSAELIECSPNIHQPIWATSSRRPSCARLSAIPSRPCSTSRATPPRC